MAKRINVAQLIDLAGGSLRVPAYQRRYVWGSARANGPDAASTLAACLLDSARSGTPYFLQGITLAGHDIVDGQQRLTFLSLLLQRLAGKTLLAIDYECRPQAKAWLDAPNLDAPDSTQDVACLKATCRAIDRIIAHADREQLLSHILNNVWVVCVHLPTTEHASATFQLLNGAKSPMLEADIIKADIIRIATDGRQRGATSWELDALRAAYCADWEAWTLWWNDAARREYYSADLPADAPPLDLLLCLCLGSRGGEIPPATSYASFIERIAADGDAPWEGAKRLLDLCRRTQKRFEEAWTAPQLYNRVRAVLLLQDDKSRIDFMRDLFVECKLGEGGLEDVYKLSFLGMTYDEILRGDTTPARFDDLVASLSMADVYHTEAKRDAYRLLLRLNIDEDTKLGRKFDFSIWNNRSLEHIFSKSKVWHVGEKGHICDGNDNELRIPKHKIEADPTYMRRDDIVNIDGAKLSEHCIGNLVLLYGQNNAAFGNAGFEQKKAMFLSPSVSGLFQSRNLLHSVCVFAGNQWTCRSIVDNYNLTLKNLKLYYGYK